MAGAGPRVAYVDGALAAEASGSERRIVVPSPSVLEAVTEPRWRSTVQRAMARPRPLPPRSRERAESER